MLVGERKEQQPHVQQPPSQQQQQQHPTPRGDFGIASPSLASYGSTPADGILSPSLALAQDGSSTSVSADSPLPYWMTKAGGSSVKQGDRRHSVTSGGSSSGSGSGGSSRTLSYPSPMQQAALLPPLPEGLTSVAEEGSGGGGGGGGGGSDTEDKMREQESPECSFLDPRSVHAYLSFWWASFGSFVRGHRFHPRRIRRTWTPFHSYCSLLACFLMGGALMFILLFYFNGFATHVPSAWGRARELTCHTTAWSASRCGINGADCQPFHSAWTAVRCPHRCTYMDAQRTVLGGAGGVYRSDSHICSAALHAGAISDDERGGCFLVRGAGGTRHFFNAAGSVRGVTSLGFPSWFPGSMQFAVFGGGDVAHCSMFGGGILTAGCLYFLFLLLLRPPGAVIWFSLLLWGYFFVLFVINDRFTQRDLFWISTVDVWIVCVFGAVLYRLAGRKALYVTQAYERESWEEWPWKICCAARVRSRVQGWVRRARRGGAVQSNSPLVRIQAVAPARPPRHPLLSVGGGAASGASSVSPDLQVSLNAPGMQYLSGHATTINGGSTGLSPADSTPTSVTMTLASPTEKALGRPLMHPSPPPGPISLSNSAFNLPASALSMHMPLRGQMRQPTPSPETPGSPVATSEWYNPPQMHLQANGEEGQATGTEDGSGGRTAAGGMRGRQSITVHLSPLDQPAGRGWPDPSTTPSFLPSPSGVAVSPVAPPSLHLRPKPAPRRGLIGFFSRALAANPAVNPDPRDGLVIRPWYELVFLYLCPFVAALHLNYLPLLPGIADVDLNAEMFTHGAGGIVLVLLVAVVLVITVWYTFRMALRAQILLRYVGIYFLALLLVLIVTLSWAGDASFHLHHCLAGLLLIPLSRFPSRVSLVLQAVATGIFLNGLAHWGFESAWDVSNPQWGVPRDAQANPSPSVIQWSNSTANSVWIGWPVPDFRTSRAIGSSIQLNGVEIYHSTYTESSYGGGWTPPQPGPWPPPPPEPVPWNGTDYLQSRGAEAMEEQVADGAGAGARPPFQLQGAGLLRVTRKGSRHWDTLTHRPIVADGADSRPHPDAALMNSLLPSLLLDPSLHYEVVPPAGGGLPRIALPSWSSPAAATTAGGGGGTGSEELTGLDDGAVVPVVSEGGLAPPPNKGSWGWWSEQQQDEEEEEGENADEVALRKHVYDGFSSALVASSAPDASRITPLSSSPPSPSLLSFSPTGWWYLFQLINLYPNSSYLVSTSYLEPSPVLGGGVQYNVGRNIIIRTKGK